MILICWFQSANTYHHSMCKILETFGVPQRKKRNCSFCGSPCIYPESNLLILLFQFLTNCMYKIHLFWNFYCCFLKEAVIFLLSQRALYIIFSKCCFLQFVAFNLSPLTYTLCLELIYSRNSRCSIKEVAI